jgi:predicted transcriptional regulator
MRTQKEIIEKILESVEVSPLSFMQLCRQSGFNYRTVRKQLEIIEYLQRNQNRVEIIRDGFRVVIKKSQTPVTAAP